MDYARFNYVAQPGDMERGVSMAPPRFGIYDKYAVKWLYTPVPDAETIEDEYKVTSNWITKASADSVYRYGKQQFYSTIDPRSQMEDLGDDAMKASRYGVKNLKYILSNMNSWVAGQDDDYAFRNSMYQNIVNQYVSYMGHVFGNIGGIYLNELKEGDPVKAYSFVPKEKQKRALRFMLEELSDMSWLDNRELLDKLAMLGSPKTAVREAIAAAVIAAPMKTTLDICAQYSDDPYTPQECYADISKFIWSPTKKGRKLTKDEMSLQRDFVLSVAKNAGLASYPGAAKKDGIQSGNTATEAIQWSFNTETATASIGDYAADPFEAFANKNQTAKVSGYGSPVFRYYTKKGVYTEYYAEMKRIEQLIRSRISTATGETKAHYQYLLHNIEKGLKK